MAATSYLTQDQADELIGQTGLIVHPAKGEQGPKGGWKCTGYAVDPEGQVTSLKLESVARTGDVPITGDVRDPKTGERSSGVIGTIPDHPLEVRPQCNPRHFQPARAILSAKAEPDNVPPAKAEPQAPAKAVAPAK